MEKGKKDESHVKRNFTFRVRYSKLSVVSEERDFRGLVTGLVETLVQESTTVNRKKNGMFMSYCNKL